MPGFFLAHELAHQWWGHGRGRPELPRALDLGGVAQYAAALWMRHRQGEEDVPRACWAAWPAGRCGENERGPIHLGHRLGHIQGDPQIYRAVVYDKGAYVLHMLRGIVGDEAFREALRPLQAGFRFAQGGHGGPARGARGRVAARTSAPYFREWVYGTALPDIEYSQRLEPAPAGFRTSWRAGAQPAGPGAPAARGGPRRRA